MALGSAHLLGYKLSPNFDMPYLATSVADFWRRWHISLSSWLRDYLFIPLGGSRGGRLLTMRNLLITMALGGLWHGASWTFVVWGALHGTYLVLHRAFCDLCRVAPRLERVVASGPGRVACVGLTFLTVTLTWVFFRTRPSPWPPRSCGGSSRSPAAGRRPSRRASSGCSRRLLVACHALGASAARKKWIPRLPAPVLGMGYAVSLALGLLMIPDAKEKVFIYFQF